MAIAALCLLAGGISVVGKVTDAPRIAASGGGLMRVAGLLAIFNIARAGDAAVDLAQAGYAMWSDIQVRPRWLWRLVIGLALAIIGTGWTVAALMDA